MAGTTGLFKVVPMQGRAWIITGENRMPAVALKTLYPAITAVPVILVMTLSAVYGFEVFPGKVFFAIRYRVTVRAAHFTGMNAVCILLGINSQIALSALRSMAAYALVI